MSQKTDGMVKLALVFFVTLLSFSIGTYVGKKYSDNQHKLALLEPKKETPASSKTDEFASDLALTDGAHGLTENEAPAEEQTIALDEQKPTALSDSEVAKIAEEFAAEEDATEEKLVATIDLQEKDLKTISDAPAAKPAMQPVVAKPVEQPMVAKPVEQPMVAKLATQPVVAKLATQPVVAKLTEQTTIQMIDQKTKTLEKPLEKTAENRLPANINLKKEVVPMLYTVQIGAYANEAEAEKVTLDLQDKGFKTSFVPAKVNGQIWYRVNVGLFGSIKEAQEYKKEFLVKTKLTSAIVQRVLQ